MSQFKIPRHAELVWSMLLTTLVAACCPLLSAGEIEANWLLNPRQLTFEGRRAGEGYFSADGSMLVFQSERDVNNPFYQIFLMDRETGDLTRISPGHGKTTCAWIHPDNNRVLFASTHGDPKSVQNQQEELEIRASGKERRYSWDYDSHFELYEFNRTTKSYKQLSHAEGYDAEGSYSPDGKLIAFASNRSAYAGNLSPGQKEAFKLDPAIMNEIYIMNADGTHVRQLTTTLGYDGGPFFSPDGKRICWRRFAENGATAEIMTMNIDGSQKQQLTTLEAMSWAPFYHPSGEYLIFTTNIHGFGNFELYVVDAAGMHDPIRITDTEGFDGLPTFTPDGKQIAWTTNRTSNKQSQIFLADWNHEAVRTALGGSESPSAVDPVAAADSSTRASQASFSSADIMRHVDYLCRPELAGRMTGSRGEQLATSYVAAVFDHLKLKPMGDEGDWFQQFDFTAGVDLGVSNSLQQNNGNSLQDFVVGNDWQPLAFSKTGKADEAGIVFAGYGITAPKDGDHEEYDSFVHLDVTGKWVVAFRFMPENISAEQRQHLAGHSSLRYKAMVARDRGAHGLIVVSGPQSKVKNQLTKLQFDGSMAGASIPVISVTDAVAKEWLASADKVLGDLQASLDTGEPQMGFAIKDLSLTANIDIKKVRRSGRNVVARLQSGDQPSEQAIMVCAHIDHLGAKGNSSSLARDEEKEKIHFGADDNASGIAAMLEVAEYLANQHRDGKLAMKRDVIFAAWSGEELGLIGSNYFANEMANAQAHGHHTHTPEPTISRQPTSDPKSEISDSNSNHAAAPHAADAHHQAPAPGSLYPALAACLNMDMVGRFEKRLVLQGVGSSSIWKSEVERRNAPIGLPITLQDDSYLPTDASTFFMRGVPILSAFTGSHSDYHTPRDTPDKLNYEAAAKIAKFMGLVTRSLTIRDEAPDYVSQTAPEKGKQRARLRAYLGTIPDYAESDIKGLKLSGVAKDGPAAKGGLQSGDVIIELAGRKIDNIYDYTYAIEALKIGQAVKVKVRRASADKSATIELEITPGSRD